MKWKPNTESDLDRYLVYRDGDQVGKVPAGETTYADSSLTNGQTYSYAISAVDTAENESAKSATKSATPQEPAAPLPPTGFAVTEQGDSLVLDWDDVTGDGIVYDVYRSQQPSVDLTEPYRSGLSESTYTDTDVVNGAVYYYRVVAVDVRDKRSEASEVRSGTAGDQESPVAPTDLAASGGDGVVDLTWSASTSDDVNGYRIYRSTSADVAIEPANEVTGVGNVTEYADGAVENGTTYYYAWLPSIGPATRRRPARSRPRRRPT